MQNIGSARASLINILYFVWRARQTASLLNTAPEHDELIDSLAAAVFTLAHHFVHQTGAVQKLVVGHVRQLNFN